MIIREKIRYATLVTLLGVMGVGGKLSAKENVSLSGHRNAGKVTAAASGCQPALAAIDLDINNVNARLMTGGDMWWNIGEGVAAYEIPTGSGKSSQFAASCWIGGIDQQGNLKVAGQTYRQTGNDYWPGSLDVNGKITEAACANWDNFWKIDKSTVNEFIQISKAGGSTSGSEFAAVNTWPGAGNPNAAGSTGPLTYVPGFTYAPFKDINGNGIYEPNLGEYPVINGDEMIWWVFNDAGNVKEQSLTAAIGVEVQTSAFAYTTQDYLNDASFYNYRVINRGAITLDSTYLTVWDDCDLGYYMDDFIGCDTSRGLGIQYNGYTCDGCSGGSPVNSYGYDVPQVGVDFFQGPQRPVVGKDTAGKDSTYLQRLGMTNFTYYNNDQSVIGNPSNGVQMYYYMTGSILSGARFKDDFQGPGITSNGYSSGPITNFVFTGDPGNKTTWSECTCNNNPGDRRFLFSSGPFQLTPGALNDITFGCIWAPGVGGCPSTSFTDIKSIDDQAQALFDDNFQTVEGPQAPRMQCVELDRKLIFYLVNDYGSNNYGENYGRNDISGSANYADSLTYHQVVVKAEAAPSTYSVTLNGQSVPASYDSLYQFEGYEVFQLANSEVSAAQIFDPTTGEVDPTQAALVFQCDKRNGVSTIVNYVVNTSISDSTWVPQIKVQGKDSGITHSFEVTQDQFAATSDRTLIDYHNYYYIAIAYAYNNFASFNSHSSSTTQDLPYLASSHGREFSAIPIVVGMPNPANGAMGTIINSGYGSGITITRIEGVGNGGNVVELDSASEATAVYNNQVDTAVYKTNSGPINVKVVDPLLVPNYNWVLQIGGTSNATTGISNAGTWTLSAFSNGKIQDTIYSEGGIGTPNEQIIEKYGISVQVDQVTVPGSNRTTGNGYITSDIVFDDPSQPWLYGVQDQPDSNIENWLRAGSNTIYNAAFSVTPNFSGTAADPCDYDDDTLDPDQAYENMLSNFTPTQSTWGPYDLAAAWEKRTHFGLGGQCPFQVAYSNTTQTLASMAALPDVDLVFTSDQSKWTRCAVVEEQELTAFAEGGAAKLTLRNHAGWNGDYTNGGQPIYSNNPADAGMSYFPGYAIDEGTGKRLNIVFGEDSWLGSDNGNDMLWNPSGNILSPFDGSALFGGRHVVYISGTQYDSDNVFVTQVRGYVAAQSLSSPLLINAYSNMQWIGMPTLNPTMSLLPLNKGLIPTTTKLRFRVNRPYAPYVAVDTNTLSLPAGIALTPGQTANPYYTFSTDGLAPTPLSDTSNRGNLLSQINVVPNPYYGYSGYEANRFDTKVRIINLPAQVTVYIYSLDGTLVNTLSKNDPSVSYLDWNIMNTAGLPVSSGMYLMDVKAVGIGETVLKWFGAQRPIDVTTY